MNSHTQFLCRGLNGLALSYLQDRSSAFTQVGAGWVFHPTLQLPLFFLGQHDFVSLGHLDLLDTLILLLDLFVNVQKATTSGGGSLLLPRSSFHVPIFDIINDTCSPPLQVFLYHAVHA